MAGAYCKFCNHRCFVERALPDGSWRGHMATCAKGMAWDRERLGYDHTTAINPILQTHEEGSHEQPRASDWKEEAIEAGARALVSGAAAITPRSLAAAVVDAVEPIIRWDQRHVSEATWARMKAAVVAEARADEAEKWDARLGRIPMRAAIRAAVAEEIAQAILDRCNDTPNGPCGRCARAAAIARRVGGVK